MPEQKVQILGGVLGSTGGSAWRILRRITAKANRDACRANERKVMTASDLRQNMQEHRALIEQSWMGLSTMADYYRIHSHAILFKRGTRIIESLCCDSQHTCSCWHWPMPTFRTRTSWRFHSWHQKPSSQQSCQICQCSRSSFCRSPSSTSRAGTRCP